MLKIFILSLEANLKRLLVSERKAFARKLQTRYQGEVLFEHQIFLFKIRFYSAIFVVLKKVHIIT